MSIETRASNNNLRQSILEKNEDHFTDFKSVRIKPAKLQQTFVAFANADGGELFVGIEDINTQSNRIVGFTQEEDANSHIETLLINTMPSVEGVDLEFIDFGQDGLVLHIIIPKSPQVHYTSDEKCYLRLNASSRRISGDKVTQLAYSKGTVNYERNLIRHIDESDVADSDILRNYLHRIKSDLDLHSFLRKQRLILKESGEWFPTVACILMFDEEPQATLDTRCAIKVYRLRTTDSDYKREHLANDHPLTIEGALEDQIHQTINVVNEILTDTMIQISGKFVKVNYPAEALRELIVNAILHRDYSLNDDIHIRIFDNRVEIASPGKLPGHINLDNILDERFSRNPNIVRLLHKLPNPVNYDIGEGLNTAFNAMNKAGLQNPQIREDSASVTVTIAHKRIASLEEIILDLLNKSNFITNKDVRNASGEESENKVKRALQKLRKEGLIEVVDPNARTFDYSYKKAGK